MRRLVGIIGTITIILLIFYFAFINYVDIGEVGVASNRITGDLTLQEERGFYVTVPWTLVARIDTRPTKVCVTSTGRDVACKLAQFEPEAYRTFVKTQGFRYYWWSNRISFNMGYDQEYRGMRDLMRGYAFSVDTYPFIKVLSEFQTAQ